MSSRVLGLNVGGQTFMIERSRLARYPHSKLAQLTIDSPSYIRETDEHFFDVDSKYMNVILGAYRDSASIVGDGKIGYQDGLDVTFLMDQLEFWGLDTTVLSPDARIRYAAELNTLSLLSHCHPEPDNTRRRWFYNLLESPRSSIGAMVWAVFILCIVLASIALFMYETTRHALNIIVIDRPPPENTSWIPAPLFPHLHMKDLCILLEALLTIVLCAEHLTRFLLAPDRRKFYTSFFNVVDMFGVYPIMLVYFLDLIEIFAGPFTTDLLYYIYFILHCLILLRLFRFLKLAFNFMSARIVLVAFLNSLKQLCTWLVCLFITTLLFANLTFFAEDHYDSYFRHSFDGLWFAIVTLTTVGYGDQRPIGMKGRLVASAFMVVAITLLSVAMAIVTSHLLWVQKLSQFIAAANNAESNKMQKKIYSMLEALKKGKGINTIFREGKSVAAGDQSTKV